MTGDGVIQVLLSAGEASADIHGAELLRALRAAAERDGRRVEAFGMGGPRLEAAGLRAIVDARSMLAMGFTEVVSRLPRILRALRRMAREAEAVRPDVAVVIDYPDFHFRLARRLGRLGIPVVYYIPPKVWAWRKGRIAILRERFARILCIFPFEVAFFRRENVPVVYVGNPLLDELPLSRTRTDARQALGLPTDARVVVLMPGSRPSELGRHVSLFLDAARLAQNAVGGRLHFLMPFPWTSEMAPLEREIRARAADLEVRVSQGDAADCLIAADAGLIKSGTSTLEAALLGCPHAVVYKTGKLTQWIFEHLIRYRGPVGLVNLVTRSEPPGRAPAAGADAEPYLAREILLDAATPAALAAELVSLLSDAGRRARQAEGFRELRARLIAGEGQPAGEPLRDAGTGPSARAAAEVLAVARAGRVARPGVL